MESHNLYENVSCLTRNDEVKFVVSDRHDFDWACDVIRRYDLTPRISSVLFSPVFQRISFEDLAQWILDCGLDVRMQIQLHKVIWPEAKRGV
jgi:7-carboxy-7-deazaguanine synthase